MSLGLEIMADISPMKGMVQSPDAATTEGSGEFSNVMDDVSSDCKGQCGSHSDSSEGHSNQQNSGKPMPADGKAAAEGGNELPDSENTESFETAMDDKVDQLSTSQSNSQDATDLVEKLLTAGEGVDLENAGVLSDQTAQLPLENADKPTFSLTHSLLQSQQIRQMQQVEPQDESVEMLQSLTENGEGDALGQLSLNPFAAGVTASGKAKTQGLSPSAATTADKLSAVALGKGEGSLFQQPLTPGHESIEQLEAKLNELRLGSGQNLEVAQEEIAAVKQQMVELEANLDQPRKADLEAMLKELVALAPKESSSSSSLLNATSLSSSGVGALGASSSSASSSILQSTPSSNVGQLLNLASAVTDQGWADDFAVRIRTLVSGNVQQATLNLNPAELGAIEVHLSTEGNETKAQFSVQNAVVREALESSLPRLKEIFQESGLSLTDTDVRDQSSSENAGDQEETGREGLAGTSALDKTENVDDERLAPSTLARWDGEQLRGGVDTFI